MRTFISILLFACSIALAQGEGNIAALGMGNVNTALSRNVDAVNWNPANLGLSSLKFFQVDMFSMGGMAGNSFFNFNAYNDIAHRPESETFTDQELQDLVSDSDQRIRMYTDLGTSGFLSFLPSFSYKRFAFTNQLKTATFLKIPSRLLRIVTLGLNQGDQIDLDVYGESWTLLETGVTYAQPLSFFKESALGVTGKFLYGLGYGEATSTLKIGTDAQNATTIVNGRGEYKYGLGGTGFAFDVGYGAVINNHWSVGLSVINMVSNINWGSLEAKRELFIPDSAAFEKLTEEIFVDGKINDRLTMKSFMQDSSEALDPFSASYPTTFRAGLAYQMKKLVISTDLEIGFEEKAGTTDLPRLGIGTEYRPLRALPLRAGFSFGGVDGYALTIGGGWDHPRWQWDWATGLSRGFTPGSAKGVNGILVLPIPAGSDLYMIPFATSLKFSL